MFPHGWVQLSNEVETPADKQVPLLGEAERGGVFPRVDRPHPFPVGAIGDDQFAVAGPPDNEGPAFLLIARGEAPELPEPDDEMAESQEESEGDSEEKSEE